jgi:hypothetical protein
MTDAFESAVRRIVEGQIRGFIKEHPSILDGVDWYKPRGGDKAQTLVGSLSKRIVRDLTCPSTKARLAEALLALETGEPSDDADGTVAVASPPGVEPNLASGGRGLNMETPK